MAIIAAIEPPDKGPGGGSLVISWELPLKEADCRSVEQFVRGTLGCRCPDEVFRSITGQADSLPGGGPAFRRLVIGERLLIYVLSYRPGPASAEHVEALAARGRTERNQCGYSRFRLVLAADTAESVTGAVIDGFAKVVGADGHAHLHVVPRRELPRAVDPT